ncbi:MAG: tetratricopeptide repeat protein [Myxococcota bacterium]
MTDDSELIAHIHRQRAQDLKSRIWLGDVQLGHLDAEAPQRMLDHLQAAAAAGDLEAFVELGEAYADGVGFQNEIPVDDERALDAFEAGAERGHFVAALRYLRLCLQRRPGPEGAGRLARWIEWLTEEDPEGEAHWIAGVAARRGYGLPQDLVAAVEWLEIAASRNHSEAMWELYEIMSQGEGRVAADRGAAHRWCVTAARGGHVQAAYALAQELAQQGDGVGDLVTAAEWFERAAHGGHPEARLALGILYLTGAGVPADPQAAAAWFDEAEESGLDVDKALAARNLVRPR